MTVSCLLLSVAWAVIWRDKVAIAPIVPVLLFAAFTQINQREANILISDDRESWAVFDSAADILHLSNGLSGFQKSLWMSRFAIRPEDADTKVMTCMDDPCGIDLEAGDEKTRIVIASQIDDPFYACRNAQIVINLRTDIPSSSCRAAGATTMVDDDVLWWKGGVSIRLPRQSDKAPTITTVKDMTANWPWIVIGGRSGG
jgi:competence protein ComEC